MEYVIVILKLICFLAAQIPLIIQLIKYVKTAAKEKDGWKHLVGLALIFIQQAEKLFEDGASRKEWVTTMILTAADQIGYKLSEDELSKLIDDLVGMSKNVNVSEK